MPSADAQISTERASRYLRQLGQHLGQLSRIRHAVPTGHRGQPPPPVQRVELTDACATIHFRNGICTMRAAPHTLTVRIDADDQDALRQLQDGVAHRLETIGRREHLTVDWRHPATGPELPSRDRVRAVAEAPAAAGTDPVRAARRLAQPLVLTAAAVLALVAHAGLLGGALAASPWMTWGSTIILAILAVKIVAVAVHLILRRRTRHRHRPPGSGGPTGE